MSGESPTRPGSLQHVPPVEVAAKRRPSLSSATARRFPARGRDDARGGVRPDSAEIGFPFGFADEFSGLQSGHAFFASEILRASAMSIMCGQFSKNSAGRREWGSSRVEGRLRRRSGAWLRP